MRTYPIGKVWGGVRFYSKSQGERIQNAVLRFTLEGAKEEPRAAVIPAETYFFRGFGNYSIVFFYDGETPPTTGSFGELLQIPCFFDWTGVSDYSALVSFSGRARPISQNTNGLCLFSQLKKLGYGCHYKGRMSFATATVPALPHILPEISTKWRSILQPHFMRTRHALSFWAMTMQPFPSTIGAHTEDRGGNAMGLRASDPDRLILEFSGMWQCKSEDETMRKMSLEIIKWLDEKTPGWVAEARRLREKDGDGDDASEADWHMPLFMNDAMDGQDVTKSYRGFEVFKTMQKSVDPDGLWAKRLGGFKYY